MLYNELLLHKIACHLLINGNYLSNLGLFHGRMGLVIFFYHYSRYIDSSVYDEFAGELLDSIFEEINDKLPVDFENGYLGIGWGIQYLATQRFIDGDINYVLEDIDKKITERDIRRLTDTSLNNGIEGYLHYFLARMQENKYKDKIFDELYLFDFMETTKKFVSTPISSLKKLLNDFHQTNILKQSTYNISNHLASFCCDEKLHYDKVYECDLGLLNGSAGIGLKTMGI